MRDGKGKGARRTRESISISLTHTQTHIHTRTWTHTHLIRISSAEVYRDESEPDDAGCVHCKTNKLALVKVLWDLAGLDGIHGAGGNEEHVVDEGEQERRVLYTALKNHLLSRWVFEPCARCFYDEPHDRRHHLRETERGGVKVR